MITISYAMIFNCVLLNYLTSRTTTSSFKESKRRWISDFEKSVSYLYFLVGICGMILSCRCTLFIFVTCFMLYLYFRIFRTFMKNVNCMETVNNSMLSILFLARPNLEPVGLACRTSPPAPTVTHAPRMHVGTQSFFQ